MMLLRIQEMLMLFYIEKFKIFWKLQIICIFLSLTLAFRTI